MLLHSSTCLMSETSKMHICDFVKVASGNRTTKQKSKSRFYRDSSYDRNVLCRICIILIGPGQKSGTVSTLKEKNSPLRGAEGE